MIPHTRALAASCALLCGACLACESPGDGDGVMAIFVTVRYPNDITLDQLRFTLLEAGDVVDAPAIFPGEPRPLDSDGETLVVYPPSASAGVTLALRVDGLGEQQILASALEQVTPRAGEQVSMDIILGEPARCGDDVVREGVEECDDGNLASGDGCTAWCTVEPGYRCDLPGQPCVPE